ncbi:DAPG hydrolase family protein [Phreatobacter sp.]|uniref:DAPG hydrolase family protein n=1 Tax=Phreatobacter sp. TaxID=1966341 RepID=UPI003F6E59F5
MSAAAALPLPRPVAVRFQGLPDPLVLPFPLRPVTSADTAVEHLPDGRVRYSIRHDVLRGVTPAMLAWWFRNLEGDIAFGGQRYNRYRFWHPRDHVHISYARRLPDGSVGPGAILRLIEVLGRDERFLVDTRSHIERLDEGGYVHNPEFHGRTGFARMEYRFERVAGGTLYENSLIVGASGPLLRLANPLVARFAFSPEKGQAWFRHNVEEVGQFEAFLPRLYHEETGLGD